MRKVGNLRQDCAQLRFVFSRILLVLFALLAQFLCLFDQRTRISAGVLQLRDLFRCAIAPRLQMFRLSNRLTPPAVEIAKAAEQLIRIHPALAQLFFHQRQIVTDEIQIKHRNL